MGRIGVLLVGLGCYCQATVVMPTERKKPFDVINRNIVPSHTEIWVTMYAQLLRDLGNE